MSFLKKNCTIIVLATIIISSLAVSIFAAPTINDHTIHDDIIIETKRHTGAYPQAIEVVLNTKSYTREHCDFIFVYCLECDLYVDDISAKALDPDRVRIVYEFPWECWRQNHYCVSFWVT